jgi:hypothetical protein
MKQGWRLRWVHITLIMPFHFDDGGLADGKGELGRTVDFEQAGCGCKRSEQVPC